MIISEETVDLAESQHCCTSRYAFTQQLTRLWLHTNSKHSFAVVLAKLDPFLLQAPTSLGRS